MTGSAAQGPRPTAPVEGRSRRWLPFWVLQATEVTVAVVLADVSIHVSNGGVLVAAALVFFALAATAQGPLGIVRICSQPLHLLLTMVAAALLAVAPVFPLLRPDVEGIIVMEFAAVGLLRLATLTRTVPTGAGSPRRFGSGPAVIDATATVIDPSTRPTPAPVPPPPPGRSSSSGAAARWAGRATGAAAASGKRAAAKYGPTAEAQVKRTIRSAGRIAGSVTSPPADPADPTD